MASEGDSGGAAAAAGRKNLPRGAPGGGGRAQSLSAGAASAANCWL